MSDSSILFTTIIVVGVLGILIRIFIWRERQKDKRNIDLHWQKFLLAEKRNDLHYLKLYINKLIWNKFLKKEQLDRIISTLKERNNGFTDPVLEKLANHAFNKKLHYDQTLASPGSSGGIKQSW